MQNCFFCAFFVNFAFFLTICNVEITFLGYNLQSTHLTLVRRTKINYIYFSGIKFLIIVANYLEKPKHHNVHFRVFRVQIFF